MCLGIPGQVDRAARGPRAPGPRRRERRRPGHQHRAPRGRELVPGDWVLIHVGFAMSKIDEDEARAGARRRSSCSGASSTTSWRRSATSRITTETPASRRRGGVMRFVDEYRDPRPRARSSRSITDLAGDDHFKFMEVCGGHTHTIYRHGIEHVLPEHGRAGARPGLPGVRDPDGPGRRRDRRGRDAGRDLHVVRRHDARARRQRQPAARRRRAAPTCASCTRRSTRCASRSRRPTATWCSSPSGSRPRRRRPRSRCSRPASSGVTNFTRVLQPRHDRPADQGDPRVARPAPRRLPRPRPRVDRRRATGRTGSCPSSTASRS